MARGYNKQQFTPADEVLTPVEAAEAIARSVFPHCCELLPARWHNADMEVSFESTKTMDSNGSTHQSSYTARYIAECPQPEEYQMSDVMNVAYLKHIADNEFAMSRELAIRELTLTLTVTVELRVKRTYTMTFSKEMDYVPAHGLDTCYHTGGALLIRHNPGAS